MTCKKCGASVSEGQAFCTNCGAPLAEERQPVQAEDLSVQSPAEEPSVQPGEIPAAVSTLTEDAPAAPKSRRRPGWIIALAAAAAVIACVVLGWGYIGNFVERTLSSPADYYHKVETRSLHAGTDALAHPTGLAAMSNRLFGMGTSDVRKATRGSVTLTAGEDLTALLSENTGTDLSWLKSVGLTFVADGTREDLQGAKAALQVNGEDVVSLDGMYSPETCMGYFRVPELSEQYASVDAQELLTGYYWENGNDVLFPLLSTLVYGGQSEAQTIMNSMPDSETVADLADRYGAIVINDLTDVERGHETVTVEGVTCAYTTLTVRADRTTLEKILRDVLTTADGDAELKDLIVKMAEQVGEDGQETYASFQEAIGEALSQEKLIDGDLDAVMVVYVNDKGEIRGRDLRIATGGGEFTMRQIYAVKGSRFGTDLGFHTPDDFALSVIGSGTAHGSSIRGTLDMQLTSGGTTTDLFTAEIDGTAKGGDFRGELVLIPTEQLLDTVLEDADLPAEMQQLVRGLRIRLINHSTEDRLDLKLALNSGESELITLLVESSEADALELSVPGDAVDAADWAGSINQISLLNLIGNLQKAGVPMSFFGNLVGLS